MLGLLPTAPGGGLDVIERLSLTRRGGLDVEDVPCWYVHSSGLGVPVVPGRGGRRAKTCKCTCNSMEFSPYRLW